jgi:UDPglucose 6-dehydrogenase
VLFLKITVVGGGGYVGLVSAVCLAHKGNTVYAVDNDQEKVAMLRQGIPLIYETGLEPLLREGLAAGRLRFTADLTEAVSAGNEIVILAVGTPEDRLGRCNLKDLLDTVADLAGLLRGGEIIVVKSTVPVGTTDRIQNFFDYLPAPGVRVYTAMCPEFLREGTSVKDFLEPSRIVIGTANPVAADTLLKLFEDFDAPKIVTSTRSAELAKYAANTYLATRISFINEIAEACEKLGGDIREVSRIIGLDPRIGMSYLNPGLGFGGPCLNKDLKALIYAVHEAGGNSGLLEAVYNRNERQMHLVLQKLKTMLGPLNNKRIGLLGLAFKAGTNDLRNSAAVNLAQRLHWMKAEVSAFDPAVDDLAGSELAGIVRLTGDIVELARDKDALVVATDWPEFRSADFNRISAVMRQPNLVDARGIFEPEEIVAAGFNYQGIGQFLQEDAPLIRQAVAE